MQLLKSCVFAVSGNMLGYSRTEREFTMLFSPATCSCWLRYAPQSEPLSWVLSHRISEITSVKYARKEKAGLCRLSLCTYVHTCMDTLSQTLPAPWNLWAAGRTQGVCLPPDLNVCFPLCGQVLPNAQLMFCFMNPLLLWGFFIIIIWAKMDP